MIDRFKHLQIPSDFEFRQKTLSYQLEIQVEAFSELYGQEHVVPYVVRNLLCEWKDNEAAKEKLDELCSTFSAEVMCDVQRKITDIIYRDAHCPGCGGPRS